MKTIAFVPARCGSLSIPLKNIVPICGQPLIYWSLKALQDAESITQIVVATDCDEIENAVHSFKLSKVDVYRRSNENAQATSSTESVMLEYIDCSNLNANDLFILVQATNPFTQSKDFDAAIRLLQSKNYDSLLTCGINKHFFWTPEGTPINYDYNNRPRRQDFKGNLVENGAFYINSIQNILTYKNRLSGNVAVYEMPSHTLYEIDEPEDLIIVEHLMYRFLPINQLLPAKKIQLFAMDVDGVLTDAGMYYGEQGDELKKFNTRDGKGIELIRNQGIKTAIITSENTAIVARRAKKLKIDYVYQGKHHGGKLEAIKEICSKEKISLNEVAYIGDDVNCFEALSEVGFPACPADAVAKVRSIPGILKLNQKGGQGVVRAFIEHLFPTQ